MSIESNKTSALPNDELRRDALLAHLELDAIIAHKKGRDVRLLVALLDRVAWAEGQEREATLQRCARWRRVAGGRSRRVTLPLAFDPALSAPPQNPHHKRAVRERAPIPGKVSATWCCRPLRVRS